MKTRITLFSVMLLLMWGVFGWFLKYNRTDTSIGMTEKEQNLTKVSIVEPVIDAGTVREDTMVSALFHMVNIGEDTLFVSYINPDCMCTNYESSSSVVPMGDTLTIQLSVNTKDKIGEQELTTVVKLNTKEGLHKLTFKMDVESK